jgi:hypothetical protein
MTLLWVLGGIELIAFPLLAVGTFSLAGPKIVSIEGALFSILTFGIVLTLKVVEELMNMNPMRAGTYSTDGVLGIMARGLEEELGVRLKEAERRFGGNGGNANQIDAGLEGDEFFVDQPGNYGEQRDDGGDREADMEEVIRGMREEHESEKGREQHDSVIVD